MSGQFGTVQIKKALGIMFDLGMGIEDALKDDNKVKLGELVSIVSSVALDIVSVVKNAGELKSELKEWDPEEREEVLLWAVDYFNLEHDKAEQVVEKLLRILKEAGDIVTIVKAD